MLSNRHHILTLWQVLLALCLLTSCIGDKLEDELKASREPVSGDSPHYLSIKLKTPDGASLTRAFHDGDENEHKVGDSGHSIIFFNKKGELMEASQLLLLGHTHHETDDDKEATYSARVYPKDNEWPASCLVVLNGSKKVNDMLAAYEEKKKREVVSYQDIISGMIWSAGQEDPKAIGFNFSDDGEEHYFTMTNSMYYDEKGVPQWPVKIPNNAIAESEEEAEEKAMTVYVERMVAKFSFTTEDIFDPVKKHNADPLIFFGGIDDNGKIEYVAIKKWIVKVTGWGINALETESNIFKMADENATYFEGWYDPDYHRSYWSEDPHYDRIVNKNGEKTTVWKYPWQYRRAIEDKNLEYYGKGQGEVYSIDHDDNLLRNYSYEYFTKYFPKDGFNDQSIYTPENTYDFDLYKNKNGEAYLDNRTNLLAGTHLIVCAELQVEDSKAEEGYSAKDVYRDRNGFYYESAKDYFTMLVHTFNKTLLSQRTMDFSLYDWVGDKEFNQNDLTAHTANQNATDKSEEVIYQLYYHDKDDEGNDIYIPLTAQYINDLTEEEFNTMFVMAPATIEHGDGRRLPWLNDNKLTIRTSADDAENKPLEIWTKDQITENKETGIGYTTIDGERLHDIEENEMDNCIKSLLYEWLGAVDHFNNGRMYYAAPVLHNGKPETDGKAETEESLGDHGVVRNNWYKFNLTDIKRIGTPVDDPEQPIVPERIDNRDIINVKIDFLPWHVVETTAPLQ